MVYSLCSFFHPLPDDWGGLCRLGTHKTFHGSFALKIMGATNPLSLLILFIFRNGGIGNLDWHGTRQLRRRSCLSLMALNWLMEKEGDHTIASICELAFIISRANVFARVSFNHAIWWRIRINTKLSQHSLRLFLSHFRFPSYTHAFG